ncbi:MAG: hypothetical protein QXS42_02705 [Zestosphaera sp.]
MKEGSNVLWHSTRKSALRAPFTLLNTGWMFDTIEYTRDDWLVYITLYVIGLAVSICVDVAFLMPLINVPAISILFTVVGYAKFFSTFHSLIRGRYEYLVTSIGVVYSFRWLWKTIKSLDFKSISLIAFIRKSGKGTANVCFYGEDGDRVEFYGFTDYEGLMRALVEVPGQDDGEQHVNSGVLSKAWGSVKIHHAEYMNPRGDKVEVTYIINVDGLPKLLEKTKTRFKGGEAKFKCAGYEFKFTPASR